MFFVLGRPIARLDDAQQKSCYSAFVDSAKSGRGGGGRVPTRSIDVCKKARRDAVAEVVEAAPELDALPEFAFYKQLQFHRPKQAAELGLGGGATQGAGGGTEWDGAGSPSEAMGSLSVSTSLAGMLRDFADTKRLAMHIWNTAQRGVRVAGAGGGAGVRRQRPDLDEDWEAAAGGDDGQGGFRFREAAVDYDAFLLRIRDRRAGALRAEVQQECQAFLRRAPLLPTEQRGNELQARAPTRAPLLQRRVRGPGVRRGGHQHLAERFSRVHREGQREEPTGVVGGWNSDRPEPDAETVRRGTARSSRINLQVSVHAVQ